MGERQAKVNEKRQYFKGWETLVLYYYSLIIFNQHCTLKLIVMLFPFLLSLRKEAS